MKENVSSEEAYMQNIIVFSTLRDVIVHPEKYDEHDREAIITSLDQIIEEMRVSLKQLLLDRDFLKADTGGQA